MVLAVSLATALAIPSLFLSTLCTWVRILLRFFDYLHTSAPGKVLVNAFSDPAPCLCTFLSTFCAPRSWLLVVPTCSATLSNQAFRIVYLYMYLHFFRSSNPRSSKCELPLRFGRSLLQHLKKQNSFGRNYRLTPRQCVHGKSVRKDLSARLALHLLSVTSPIAVGVPDQLLATIQFRHGHPHKSIGSALQITCRLLEHCVQDRWPSCEDIYKSNVRSNCLKLQPIISILQARVDAAGNAAEMIVRACVSDLVGALLFSD